MNLAWIRSVGQGVRVKERRRGPDGWIRVLQGLVILCWGGFVALLSLYHFARPEVAYGFLVYGGVKVRQSWDPLLTPWLERGLWGCCLLTLVVLEWAYYARTARGQALVESRREYVEAARGQGIGRWRILLGHILPNCLPPLIVIGALQIARAITLEATLSFLGLGVPITEPSLGLLIANGYQYLLSNEYWISVFPGVALLLTIVAINLVGDRLRDVLNPRLQS